MTLGRNIYKLRRSRMLTASALAKRSHISRGHLFNIENESFSPGIRTLEKISAALDIGLGRLLTLGPSEIVLEDSFVQQVGTFLPRLNQQQRQHLLTTLRAAPRQKDRY